jgi:hypothetical protein
MPDASQALHGASAERCRLGELVASRTYRRLVEGLRRRHSRRFVALKGKWWPRHATRELWVNAETHITARILDE